MEVKYIIHAGIGHNGTRYQHYTATELIEMHRLQGKKVIILDPLRPSGELGVPEGSILDIVHIYPPNSYQEESYD
jgi:hypothetical protein